MVPSGYSLVMSSIDWKLVVDALAAIGSVSAAVVALWIATSDRTERKKERRAADEAQAKLVLASTTSRPASGPEEEVDFWLKYWNEGDHPILDVRIEKYVVRGVDGVTAQLPGGTIGMVKAHSDGRYNGVRLTDANGKHYPYRQKMDRPYSWPENWSPNPEGLDLVGWLGFTDPQGNRWARSSEGELRLIRKPADLNDLSG
jgi:hypothetical protein